MKLYPVPGGAWAGTEADWKAVMKAKGLNPKEFEATKTREVPTGKKELMEFLTFFGVDVYRLGDDIVVPGVDVEALRAKHNPDPGAPQTNSDRPAGAGADYSVLGTLDAEFVAAPLMLQLSLAVVAIDAAGKLLRDNKLT